ncbi:MAG: 3-methyl-2-oxobutanoate hydroxymethyltransferase [Kiritimatiellae bacterium]|nr:3-methyl-2-oxobutanoate hydroxymethyltransferase [Kiritimatiellia bacterium]
MSTKWTAPRIRALKGKQRFAMLTAYDYTTAQLMDEAEIPMLLVGDSLGMTVLGYENTLPVTLEQMLHHSAAVSRGAKNAMVIADLPFLTYQVSIEEAILNAGRCIKEAGVDGVKLEGGEIRAPHVRALVENGIPVLGHIGLTPQSVHAMGGFRVQGKTESDIERLIRDARALEDAGIFALVLEGMPSDTARRITEAISVPTIGIGAGPHCDGQVLVVNDLLGLTERPPKFAKKYADLRSELQRSFSSFKEEVESGTFPAPEHEY